MRSISFQHFHFPLLGLSVAMISYGLCTNDWECGNLYTECFKTFSMIAVLVMYSTGLGGLALVFITDLFGFCNSKWIPGPCCTSVKIIILCFSSCAIMAGNFYYTYWMFPYWSYAITLIGGVLSMAVLVMVIANCRCFASKL